MSRESFLPVLLPGFRRRHGKRARKAVFAHYAKQLRELRRRHGLVKIGPNAWVLY